ncbi:MAG: YjbQ family protein [Deltaproteobacteria bacterium]|nr:YjbQ family protein [Deltaproteobacteria bacterium]
MKLISDIIQIDTTGDTDVLDITPVATDIVRKYQVKTGTCLLFVPGSTGALTTIEFESGVIQDLRDAIERAAPKGMPYAHDKRWGDGNGYSHVRAALIGPSLNVPISEGGLMLGTWQHIVLLDFDNRPRTRRIVVQILSE